MTTIRFKSTGLKFPAVYEPATSPFGSKARFQLSTTFADMPEVLQSVIRCRTLVRVREFLNMNTPRRIRVIERSGRYLKLVDFLNIADAANVPRDSLLRDAPASIEAEWVLIEQNQTDRLPPRFEKLVPLSITISVDDLNLPD